MRNKIEIKGVVVHGRRLGRELGFPTANISVDSTLDAKNGVYVVRVFVGEEVYGGVANLGVRPTVYESSTERVLEVNIFEFCEDIYGRQIKVELIEFLREEEKFESIDALKSQMEKDRRKAEEFFR